MLDVVTCHVSSEEMFVASSLQVYVFSLRTRVAADGVQETFKIATCSDDVTVKVFDFARCEAGVFSSRILSTRCGLTITM